MEFSTPPLPMTHIIPTGGGGGGGGGSGTLRRGIRGIVPPPDVTHHTNHSKSTHDLHNNSSNQNGSQGMNNLSNLSQISSSTPKPPQGILKDPNRKQQQHQQQQLQHNNLQILNVQNAPGIANNLLVGGYDPNTHNLSSFNASMGYTDADGHLV